MSNLAAAHSLIESGLSIAPIKTDGTKRPAIEWKPYQNRLARPDEIEQWFASPKGIGVIGGSVSGNLEILDFDDTTTASAWLAEMQASAPDLLARLPKVQTPTGGLHVYYRCEIPVAGNQKLAQRLNATGRPEVLIETRGEGGYVIAVGSPASCHPSGKEYQFVDGDLQSVPVLSGDDRSFLLSMCKSFNEYFSEKVIPLPSPSNDGSRPGDHFNAAASWDDILLPHGWTKEGGRAEATFWKRPGKTDPGMSATTNHGGTDLLYCFSSNSHPFEADRGYSKFSAYALLNHGGNFKDAARSVSDPSPKAVVADADWGEPEPISMELLPVPHFPTSALPDCFRPAISDIANRMQCPVDYLAVAFMVITSSVVGAGCAIKPKRRDDWLVIPNLWGGVVARPGSLKSPALNEPLKLLARLEAEAAEEHQQLARTFEIQQEIAEEVAKNRKSMLRAAVKDGDEGKLQELHQEMMAEREEKAPGVRRYRTNDATIEKMAELMRDNPRGILLFRDELAGLLSLLDREDKETERAFFLESWNGDGSYTSDRIGRGSTQVKNLCTSVLGGIQPDRLSRYLHQAVNQGLNDGLVQRFQLLVYPDPIQQWRLVDESPNKAARSQVFDIVKKLSQMNFVDHGAKSHESGTCYFGFTDDAQQLFYNWISKLETEKLAGEDSTVIQEHLSKYRSLMPSLALLNHLIDIASGASSGSVSLVATQRAIAWCEYLEAHARRIYGTVTNQSDRAAIALAEKIQKGKLRSPFTLRDVHQSGWTGLTENTVIREALQALIDMGWLKSYELTPGPNGGRRTFQYFANPSVLLHSGS